MDTYNFGLKLSRFEKSPTITSPGAAINGNAGISVY